VFRHAVRRLVIKYALPHQDRNTLSQVGADANRQASKLLKNDP